MPDASVPTPRPPHSPQFDRQIALPGFGQSAQQKLVAARVLVIGAGGLGSAVIPALAAAGVGTIGIIDDDRVELSNLHRQLIHGHADVGALKVHSAKNSVAALSQLVTTIPIDARLSRTNALRLFESYDLIVDGSDNFATRYLANDAAAICAKPLVWGAVAQYGGQTGVAWAGRGPTYRDLFPVPPAADSTLSCAEGGVLPTVCAVIGAIMATEVLKIITGVGEPLIGRVAMFDALTGSFRELSYLADSTAAPITELLGNFTSNIDSAELAADLATGTPPSLVDVREPWEFEIARLPGAILVPLAELGGWIADRATNRGDGSTDGSVTNPFETERIIVYCHHGIRSATALNQLIAAGFSTARNLEGGIDAWSRTIDSRVARY